MAFKCLQKLPVSATKQPIREITFVIDGITLGKWSEMEGGGPWLGVGSVTACWLENPATTAVVDLLADKTSLCVPYKHYRSCQSW